jgi:transcriptional regulator with XRE-family HTH domain
MTRRLIPNTRLRRLREEADLSVTEAASRAAVSKSYWAMLESGAIGEPGLVKGIRIAAALGVTEISAIKRLFQG